MDNRVDPFDCIDEVDLRKIEPPKTLPPEDENYAVPVWDRDYMARVGGEAGRRKEKQTLQATVGLVAAIALLVVLVALGFGAGVNVPLLLLVAAFSLAFYFLPAIVAICNGHVNALAILVFNLFLGWTFLGWVLALVWACMAPQKND